MSAARPRIRLALAFALALAARAPAGDAAHYVDASLDLDGELLSWRFVDLDRDGQVELVLAVRPPSGARELRVHAVSAERVDPRPRQVVPVLDDVVAFGVGDVRDEPGAELLFLTRAGLWSYSPALAGYRDNVAPLVRAELVYELPDPHALPCWAFVLPAEGRDLVLVPEREQLSLWGPDPEQGGAYARRAIFPTRAAPEGTSDRAPSAPQHGVEVRVEDDEAFLLDGERDPDALFSVAHGYLAPALVDLDGDGWLDLVVDRGDELALHLGSPAGPPEVPTRVERLPEELRSDADRSLELRLVDLDGDRFLDLLALLEEDVEGFRNGVQRLLLYHGDPQALLREKPDQVLRFEAAVLRADLADVDGDGRRDLAVRKLELPTMLETMTGLEFRYTYLVYLGEKRGLARRPVLEQTETYDEESVARLAANRELSLDCDGDGIADLVEIDLAGRIAIRRLRRESSFLRGDTWSVESTPWKLFEDAGEILSLSVADRNGDGLADVVSAGERRLTVLWSVRGSER